MNEPKAFGESFSALVKSYEDSQAAKECIALAEQQKRKDEERGFYRDMQAMFDEAVTPFMQQAVQELEAMGYPGSVTIREDVAMLSRDRVMTGITINMTNAKGTPSSRLDGNAPFLDIAIIRHDRSIKFTSKLATGPCKLRTVHLEQFDASVVQQEIMAFASGIFAS